jgi:hypothetical protein
MTDTALNLVERVLPEGVPLRQWVCSLPWRLRSLCGYDSALCVDVMKAFEKEVSRSLRHRAKSALGLDSVAQAYTGAVLFIQRFDAALRLNVHGHLLSLDGVYVRAPDGALVFHELAEPSAADLPRQAPDRRRTTDAHGRRAIALRAQTRMEGRHARSPPFAARPVRSDLRADPATRFPHGALPRRTEQSFIAEE